MKIFIIRLIYTFTVFKVTFGLPLQNDPAKMIILPVSVMQQNAQLRGPLDFIGNWIQSSNFFPIEINVPDAVSTVGNTVGGWASNVGNFAQNVGSTVQGFTQNVGNGIQNFAQSLTQRVPFIGAFIRPTGSNQRYLVLIPVNNNNQVRRDFNADESIFDVFP